MAKGLEWESDYVLHAADGNIPFDRATESADEIQETRLQERPPSVLADLLPWFEPVSVRRATLYF